MIKLQYKLEFEFDEKSNHNLLLVNQMSYMLVNFLNSNACVSDVKPIILDNEYKLEFVFDETQIDGLTLSSQMSYMLATFLRDNLEIKNPRPTLTILEGGLS